MASTTTPPARYTRQVIALLEPEDADRLERDALNKGRSKSETARTYLLAGRELHEIAAEHGVEVSELVNAARLHALRTTGRSGVEIGATR